MSTYLACEVCHTTRYNDRDHRYPHRPGCPAASARHERSEQDAAEFPSGPDDFERLDAWRATDEGRRHAADEAAAQAKTMNYRRRQR